MNTWQSFNYEVKKLKKLVESFRSGEKYIQLEKAYQKIIDSLKREIRQLKAGLAAAHAETVNVRNKWFQTCEDVIKEKEAALARKDREVKKAMEAMYRAQEQCDEAMEKLREKGHGGVKGSPAELYQGTVISDHGATFQNYGNRRQECLVHAGRYLRPSIENEPRLKWNKEMPEWIKEAIHYRNSIPEGGMQTKKK